MISLRRFTNFTRDAKYQRQVALTAKRVGRAGQISRSSVETGDGTASVGDLLADAPTVAETVEDHVADLETLDPGLDVFDDTQETEDAAHQADMAAIGANLVVTEALDAAEGAAELAVLAKATADGRNRVYAQMIKPVAHPDTPFVAGDLWYQTDATGRFIGVAVWNATDADFKPYQMVAGSLLVPGSVGPTLIENGAITTGKLAATAIDGMTVTGALLRTAAAGARFELTNIGLIGYNSFGAVTARMTPSAGGLSIANPAGDQTTIMTGQQINVAKTATSTGAEVSIVRGGVTSKAQSELSGIGANNGESALLPALTRAQRTIGTGAYPAYGSDDASISARSDEAALGLLHRAAGSTASVGIDLRVGGAAGSYFSLLESHGPAELEVNANGGIYLNSSSVRFQGDTDGWVDITSSMQAAFRGFIEYRVKGGIVLLNVTINNATFASSAYTDFATLPPGVPTPNRNMQVSFQAGSTSSPIRNMRLTSAGVLAARTSASASGDTPGYFTYSV